MQSLLSNEELSGVAALIHRNEFNTVINDMDHYSGSNDDKCVLCNFHDGCGLKTTKIDGKSFANDTHAIIIGMTQPECLLPSLRCPGAEGFYSRINVVSPKVHCTKFQCVKALNELDKHVPSNVWALLMKDKVIGKEKLNNDAIDVHERFFDDKSEQN